MGFDVLTLAGGAVLVLAFLAGMFVLARIDG
jgi:hypothetical protein